MDFIFNSRQKKVEVFYENETEQTALFDFLGKHMKFKTGGIPTDNVYINGPEISWATVGAQPQYSIAATNDLSGAITLNNGIASTVKASEIEKAISNNINPDPKKALASVKLDNSSDEGGYGGITAYVPRKTE